MTGKTMIFGILLTLGSTSAFATSVVQQPEPSERLAIALYEGDSATTTRKADKRRLANALRNLQALGGHPADEHEINVAENWRLKAGPAFRKHEEATVYRGRVLGPAYRSGLVAPGAPINTAQLFLAGQVASLAVAPAKGSKRGLIVTNGKGVTICKSTVQEPASSCRWIPTFSERYQIRIDNLGTSPAKYFLVVN